MSTFSGEIKKIEVNRDSCAGVGACVSIAPQIFQLDDEGKAVVDESNKVNKETLLSAAKSCPHNAISLYDEEGKVIPL